MSLSTKMGNIEIVVPNVPNDRGVIATRWFQTELSHYLGNREAGSNYLFQEITLMPVFGCRH
jgi:hypothetical protein